MFKIVMKWLTPWKEVKFTDMPKDTALDLLEACYRADLYAKRNTNAKFLVVSNETGGVEYETI